MKRTMKFTARLVFLWAVGMVLINILTSFFPMHYTFIRVLSFLFGGLAVVLAAVTLDKEW